MTHSFPTRRSSDLLTGYIGAIVYNAADENVSDNRYLMMLNSDGDTDTYMTLPVVSRYVVPTAGTYRVELMYQATVDFDPFDALPGSDLEVTRRSEEHTSELQSLMRISYAVLCLQKKITKIDH